MNIKIVCDGTIAGTKVINEDTGETLQVVQSVSWETGNDSSTMTFYKSAVKSIIIKMNIEDINEPCDVCGFVGKAHHFCAPLFLDK